MQSIVQKFNRNLYGQLNQLKQQVEQNNMETVNNCQEAINHALNDMSNPQTVVFCIKFIKDLVETLNFSFINWIEINVLPHMEQIGRFQHHSQNMDRGKYFFNGNPTKEESQYGQTLLILVLECLQAWARWFPKFNGKETQFIRVYDLLKDLKVTFPQPTYFKVELVEKIAQNIQDLQPKIQQRPSVIKLTLSEKGEQQLMKYQQLKLDINQALKDKNISKLSEINKQYEQLQAQSLVDDLLQSDLPNHTDLAEQLLDFEDKGSAFNTEYKKKYDSDEAKLQHFILFYLQTKQEILTPTPNPDQFQQMKQEASKILNDDNENDQFNVPQKQQLQSSNFQQSHYSQQQQQQQQQQQPQYQQQQQQQMVSSQLQENQVIDELRKKEAAHLQKISELQHRIGVQELDIQEQQLQLVNTKKNYDRQIFDLKNEQRDNQVLDNQQDQIIKKLEEKDQTIQQQQIEIQKFKRIIEELNFQLNQVKESHDNLSNQQNQIQGQANKFNEVMRDYNSLQQNYQEQNELFQIKELQLQDQLKKAQMLLSLKEESISELTYVLQQQKFQLEQDGQNRNEFDALYHKQSENENKVSNLEKECQRLKLQNENMNKVNQKLKEENTIIVNKQQEILEANLNYSRYNEEKQKTIQLLESQQLILSQEIQKLQELLANQQHIEGPKFHLFEHNFSLFEKVMKVERSEGKNLQKPSNHKEARKVDPIVANLIYPVNPVDYYKFREKKISQYKGKQVALAYTLEKQSQLYKDSCLLDESMIFSGTIVNVYQINKVQVNIISFLLLFKLSSHKTYKIRSLDFQGCEYNVIGQVPQLLEQDFMIEVNMQLGSNPLICSLILDDIDQNHVLRFQLANLISKGICIDNNFDNQLLRHYWRTMKTIFKSSNLFSIRLDGSDILQKFPQFTLMTRESKVNDYQVGIGDMKLGFLFRMENKYYLLRLVLKPNNQGLIQIGSENGSMELSSKIITDYQQALN